MQRVVQLIRSIIVILQRFVWGRLGKLVRSPRLWELVETMGIVIFVGPNGSGKSLAMVESALRVLRGVEWTCDDIDHRHNRPAKTHVLDCEICPTLPVGHYCDEGRAILDAGCNTGQRYVYSTVQLLGDDGRPHPLSRPLHDYRQLMTLEHCDVLFDEVASISDAADSGSIPTQVVTWLQQLRKRDVRLRVTTPSFDRCSKPIRQVAQLLVDARAFMPELASNGRLWRPRQGMIYTAYDARDFEHYSGTKDQKARLKTLARAFFWRPGSEASERYNTLQQVLALAHVTETGMCAVCGGRRARPACSCASDVDSMYEAGHEFVVHEKVTPSGTRTRSVEFIGAPVALVEGQRKTPTT